MKGGTAQQRRKTRWREAETSLSLFYTETRNNVGELKTTQMSEQPPCPWGTVRSAGPKVGRPPLTVPGHGQLYLQSRPNLKPLRSPNPGKRTCKFLTPLILHPSEAAFSAASDWKMGKEVEMSTPSLMTVKWYKSQQGFSEVRRWGG